MKTQAVVTVRYPSELHEWLRKIAAKNHRSMNSQMIAIIEEAKRRNDFQEEAKQ